MIPRVHKKILHRPRLVEKMRRELDLALTLISAPAGYGKTSLLVDLCDAIAYPVCWLSLDESDQDFGVFVLHLTQAIQHRYPGFGGRILQAQEANPDLVNNLDALCNVFLQDLAENVSAYTVLVLDDYHLLDRSWKVGKLLGAMAQYARRQWHLIVSGRTNPGNLPSIDLLADDLMAFVSQEDLAFSADEVQQVLQMRHDVNLTPEQARELVALSEGWITGIMLATNVMWRGIRDVLVQARAQEEQIYTYLANHAFNDLPVPLREKMLDSSTLEEMSVELCNRALGLQGLGQVLPEMERRGVFLTVREDENGVEHYRYHHLLRDFLQNHLRQQNPGRFTQLHGQAAAYFEAQEQWCSAVAHRRAAGDEQATAQTMENGAKPMFLAGRLETLVAWYENVPPALRPEVPRLLLFAGRALFDLGRADETIPLLHQAENIFDQRGEMEHKLAAMLQQATVRYVQGRYTEMLDVARESLIVQETLDPKFPGLIAEAHRLIGIANLYLGQSEKAVEYFQKALDIHQALGAREMAVTYLDLSLALLRMGRLSKGWACQDRAIELLRQLGPSNYLAMTLNNVACERHYLTGNYDQALALLREALDIARISGAQPAQAVALLSSADLYRDLGALERARQLYAQAEEIAQRLDHATLVNFALLGVAQTLVYTGDVVKALGLAAQARDQAQRRGDVYQLGLSLLTLGMTHIEMGNPQVALDEIERGLEQLQKSDARRDTTRAHMLLARAHQASGDIKGALQALGRALDVGIETQTFHYLVIEGQHVFDLLERMLRQNPADRRTAQIMDRIRSLPHIAHQVVGGAAPAVLRRRPALCFYGFGPGHAERDGRPAELKSAKARHMLFYLLTYPSRSRDQIFEVFWPDLNLRSAKSAFHCTKYQARKALNRNLIVYEDSAYKIAWGPDCWFDVAVFESLLNDNGDNRQTRLEEAVSLYRGDFMEGYDAEWCRLVRERLQMRYRDALLELGELYLKKKKVADALLTLKQVIVLDDFYEPAIQALMRLYVHDNQPYAASKLYRQLQRRLQSIGAFPGRETQALYHSVQTRL